MTVKVWIDELERNVIFTGKWVMQDKRRKVVYLDEILWDESLYSKKENQIIGDHIDEAAKELFEEADKEERESKLLCDEY